MAAIITNKFRINNAEQFVESFSETAATTYYLFIGRSHSWASDADAQGNTIAEGTDASPPTPNTVLVYRESVDPDQCNASVTSILVFEEDT